MELIAKRISFVFLFHSTDESATENVLKAIQTFASLCGLLDLQIPRDAFITAICKASLPPHYALTVLNNAPQGIPSARSQEMSQFNPTNSSEPDYRQQVVAVGTPLPTASLPIGKIYLFIYLYVIRNEPFLRNVQQIAIVFKYNI